MTVQKFRMATNQEEAARIPGEFPCTEYVIKAQAGLYPPTHNNRDLSILLLHIRVRTFLGLNFTYRMRSLPRALP